MKINTPLLLAILSITELIVTREMTGTFFLWCGYGIYKFNS